MKSDHDYFKMSSLGQSKNSFKLIKYINCCDCFTWKTRKVQGNLVSQGIFAIVILREFCLYSDK